MQIENSTIIITGGGSGLGLACAMAITKLGGTAVVLDRDLSEAGDYLGFQLDVTDAAQLTETIDDIVAEHGKIDGLVAAAGLDQPGELDELSAADWDRVVAVNLTGTVNAVRAALPHLKQSHGRVVTVSSTLALKGAAGATAYSASKFAVRGFSQALATETAGQVGVTNLIPGGMKTRFFDGREERYRPADDTRLNEPAQAAETVIFALSRPQNVEIRELLVAHDEEGSWP